MRILFCCLGDFKAPPGARQILLLAQALENAGHDALVLVEGDPGTVRLVGDARDGIRTGRYRFVGPRLARETRREVQAFAPDLVHCYEPRTAPLSAALELSRAHGVPLCVRFADDDELLYREAGGAGLRGRLGRPAMIAAGTLLPRRWPYKHPLHHRRMLRQAAGYDAITPALAAEVSRRYGVACRGILPAVPPPDPVRADGAELRRRLGLPASGSIVLYTGSVFRAHYPDFELLLRAFGTVAAQHPDAILVHTGRIADRYPEPDLRALAAPAGSDRMHFLGFLHDPADLVALLAHADVLVQPGAPTDFNRLRLPAKVHDYLLAGRPVVTFAVGVGELLRDREDAVLTRTAEPSELAAAILWVLADRGRADALAVRGRERAVELFDPKRVAAETLDYYAGVTARRQTRSESPA